MEYEDKTFNASASLQLDSVANIHIRGLEVITCGAQISRVQNVSPLLKTWGRTTIHSVSRLCIDVVNSLKSLESSTADLTELLYTMSALVTAGKDWSGRIIEDSEQHFADLVALMYDPVVLSDQVETYLYKIERPNRLQDLLFRPRTDIALPPVTKTGQAHRFLEAMRNACTLRCLLITEDGHVGLGPQVSKLGDVLCILKDATVPLLLRPIAGSDSFKLVGETYMQGMMLGEVTISQVEQIVLSDKPFADPVELEVVTNNPSQM
ncbi:hypothetical protein Daus18300_004106 [Diaporthe australafricana]|uniref:CBS domain-containing protein n=1 Tax=Diaporthe australafricana TaxID=127596 RepID=A0ABR3XB48_9PEZI